MTIEDLQKAIDDGYEYCICTNPIKNDYEFCKMALIDAMYLKSWEEKLNKGETVYEWAESLGFNSIQDEIEILNFRDQCVHGLFGSSIYLRPNEYVKFCSNCDKQFLIEDINSIDRAKENERFFRWYEDNH